MDTISLEGLEFFAYHGYHDEEQKIGNKYVVDLTIELNLSVSGVNDQLSDTIDYSALYDIAKTEMSTQSRLLENIASRIAKTILEHHAAIKSIQISVSKFNPPIGGICSKSKITIHRTHLDFELS